MKNTALRLLSIIILFVGFAGYSFISAYDEGSWFPPVTNTTPPSHNVSTPINQGSSVNTTQSGHGILGFDQLLAFDKVNSDQYCDRNGINCFSPGINYYFNVLVVRSSAGSVTTDDPTYWPLGNVFTPPHTVAISNYIISKTITDDRLDACFITSNVAHAREDERETSAGGCKLGHSGDNTWTLSALAEQRTVAECAMSCIGSGSNSGAFIATPTGYYWYTSSYGMCMGGSISGCQFEGTQSRIVVCKSSDGVVWPDSNCLSPKPIETQSCTGGHNSYSCSH